MMKVTGSPKRESVSKTGAVTETAQKAKSGNPVLGQIKLDDLSRRG